MRVPDYVLKCVGFVGEAVSEDEQTHYDVCATGFFVSVPGVTTEDYHAVYFVTARHVAKDLENSKDVRFVVNKNFGGLTYISGCGDYWWTHPTDATADVAVIQVPFSPEADAISVSVNDFALPDVIRQRHIGIGDEVYSTGLFTAVPGVTRNNPILRHGNIAMMPTDQIQTDMGYADVYLIEARSIGGMSGSPVFTHYTVARKIKLDDGTDSFAISNGPGTFLLGLIHGHWDIKESDINKPSIVQDRQRGVNYGIAIVVPAIKIYETLYQSELVAMRKEQEAQILRRSVPGMDSKKPTATTEEPIFTQEDFENALTKVTRKVPPVSKN